LANLHNWVARKGEVIFWQVADEVNPGWFGGTRGCSYLTLMYVACNECQLVDVLMSCIFRGHVSVFAYFNVSACFQSLQLSLPSEKETTTSFAIWRGDMRLLD
jgi:hypothetical protein